MNKDTKMSNRNYIVIGNDGQEIINNDNLLHPGYIIEMEIEAKRLKKQDVARMLDIKPQHLSELLNEKRNVSAMLALKLEQVFGLDADYWLRVQSGYDLAKARRKMALSHHEQQDLPNHAA
jgi:addiction module HigA family antidote